MGRTAVLLAAVLISSPCLGAEWPDLTGQTITIAGPYIGPDEEHFRAVIAPFAKATGATVDYAGSQNFAQQIAIDTSSGSAPNLAIFPLPGLAASLAEQGKLAPLGEETGQWLRDNYAAGQSWVDLGTYKGPDGTPALYGFTYKTDLKSLVWYSPDEFADAGYQVPKTFEDLQGLTERIVADGHTPWCIGIGSGAATGWPATDWVEDLLLRLQPPNVYDQWTSHQIPFDDPRIVEAIDLFGWFAKDEAKVAGGSAAVTTTDFGDSPRGLFSVPPQCYLHHQASFISSFFPTDVVLGEDADFFYFPSYAGKDLGNPVLGAGTLFAITNDSPGARAFIDYLKTPQAHEIWMALGGFLTPYKSASLDAYPNDTLKEQGRILLDATTFRFDGSDLMPSAVGAGTFWTGMVDFVSGKSAGEVASAIEQSWQSVK